jgi:hypothetical protein
MAKGDTLAKFFPNGFEPTPVEYAVVDTVSGHPIVAYSDTTAKGGVWTDVLQSNYGGQGITAYIHTLAVSATNGTAGWLVSFDRVGDNQRVLSEDSYAAEITAVPTSVPATATRVFIIAVTCGSGAALDSIAAGESYHFRARRDVSSDNAVGNTGIVAIELRET